MDGGLVAAVEYWGADEAYQLEDAKQGKWVQENKKESTLKVYIKAGDNFYRESAGSMRCVE